MSLKTLMITQTRSRIRCTDRQVNTLRALGLKRIRQVVQHNDCPQLRGMLQVVAHLVEVKETNS